MSYLPRTQKEAKFTEADGWIVSADFADELEGISSTQQAFLNVACDQRDAAIKERDDFQRILGATQKAWDELDQLSRTALLSWPKHLPFTPEAQALHSALNPATRATP